MVDNVCEGSCLFYHSTARNFRTCSETGHSDWGFSWFLQSFTTNHWIVPKTRPRRLPTIRFVKYLFKTFYLSKLKTGSLLKKISLSSGKVKMFLAGQKKRAFLNQTLYHSVHTGHLLICVLRNVNIAHIFSSLLFKVHFTFIVLCTRSFFFTVSRQNPLCIYLLSLNTTCPCYFFVQDSTIEHKAVVLYGMGIFEVK